MNALLGRGIATVAAVLVYGWINFLMYPVSTILGRRRGQAAREQRYRLRHLDLGDAVFRQHRHPVGHSAGRIGSDLVDPGEALADPRSHRRLVRVARGGA